MAITNTDTHGLLGTVWVVGVGSRDLPGCPDSQAGSSPPRPPCPWCLLLGAGHYSLRRAVGVATTVIRIGLIDYRYSGQMDDHRQDYNPRTLKPATVFVQPHHPCGFATPDGHPCDDFRPSGGEHSFLLTISYGMAMSVHRRRQTESFNLPRTHALPWHCVTGIHPLHTHTGYKWQESMIAVICLSYYFKKEI